MSIVLFAIIGAKLKLGAIYWFCLGIYGLCAFVSWVLNMENW